MPSVEPQQTADLALRIIIEHIGLGDETGLEISISHLPPEPASGNRIEHRCFLLSTISQNWRGQPLVSRARKPCSKRFSVRWSRRDPLLCRRGRLCRSGVNRVEQELVSAVRLPAKHCFYAQQV